MAQITLCMPIIGAWDQIKSAPSLPLSLLASVVLAEKHYDVKIIDQRLDPNWKKHLENELDDCLFVGTTAMQGPQILNALEMLKVVKVHNSEIPTVFGGAHASLAPYVTLRHPLVDIAVIGDGYEATLELANHFKNGEPRLEDICGIMFKRKLFSQSNRSKKQHNTKTNSRKEEYIRTEPRPLIDINKLPDLPYHLVNVKKHLPVIYGTPSLSLFTSIGCPFGCKFCWNVLFSWRWRSIRTDILVPRIQRLKENYDIEGVWFIDDAFFVDLKRDERIIQAMKKMELAWACQGTSINSVSRMDDRYLKMLEDAGCKQLNMGVESGSQRILDMIGKPITPYIVIATNRSLAKYNIRAWYYFMVGFPTETLDEIKMTVKLALRLLEDNPNARISPFAAFTPYVGTEMCVFSEKYGYKPPADLELCANLATDNINTPWINRGLSEYVRGLQFTSLLIDRKAEDVVNARLLRLLSRLYKPIAKYRFKNLKFGWMLEDNIAFKIRDMAAVGAV